MLIQNSGTPPPHTLSSKAAAPFPSSCLITEKICGPEGRKANLSDKRQAAAQGSAGKGIRAVPTKHALTSGHRRHRAPCSRSSNLTADERICCCFQGPVRLSAAGLIRREESHNTELLSEGGGRKNTTKHWKLLLP